MDTMSVSLGAKSYKKTQHPLGPNMVPLFLPGVVVFSVLEQERSSLPAMCATLGPAGLTAASHL